MGIMCKRYKAFFAILLPINRPASDSFPVQQLAGSVSYGQAKILILASAIVEEETQNYPDCLELPL